MCWVERIGEALYAQLARKENEPTLMRILLRLAENERRTGDLVQKELDPSLPPPPRWMEKLAVGAATLFFRCLPRAILWRGLRKVLRRRMYQRWFDLYQAMNPVLWRSLSDHEKLQHDLLRPYWECHSKEGIWKK